MTAEVIALSTGHILVVLEKSLKESAFMFYETFWALVLGFGLSGALQAFATRTAMQRHLGDHRPPAIMRATGYGMLSSSCSYAASAMAKSLFQKGADFVACTVFMFASTNLVAELGIVLVVLIGWQFMVAEFIGGAIMIVLLSLAGAAFFRGRALEDAYQKVGANRSEVTRDTGDSRRLLGERVTKAAGWTDAARYMMADLTMLRREMLVGYGIAGLLAISVPTSTWNVMFLHGHGLATTLENVAIGPLIALVSFVCSIGNVPLAAALWSGGIGFGGVVSFLFADLITLPLLFVYRRLYGIRLTLRMLGVFWIVMSIAGLLTETIFRTAGIDPRAHSVRSVQEHFSWNYTSVLDLAFLLIFALALMLSRRASRFGGEDRFAIDPVCSMQVETNGAPYWSDHEGIVFHFCSDRCRDRFERAPARYVDARDRLRAGQGVEQANDLAGALSKSSTPKV